MSSSTIAMPYGAMPEPDVVDLLMRQHTRIRDGMIEVMAGSGDQRRTAFRELVRLLSVHEAAEEEVVHPALRRHASAGDAIADDRLKEEHDAKVLLDQLDGMDPDASDFMPLFLRLREAVLTHAVSEQRYEFNNLRHQAGPSELQAMRLLVQVAEKVAPTHPHPGIESATANIVAGTPTAIIDRTRDAIRAARRRTSGSGG